jgi:hypothetical protein
MLYRSLCFILGVQHGFVFSIHFMLWRILLYIHTNVKWFRVPSSRGNLDIFQIICSNKSFYNSSIQILRRTLSLSPLIVISSSHPNVFACVQTFISLGRITVLFSTCLILSIIFSTIFSFHLLDNDCVNIKKKGKSFLRYKILLRYVTLPHNEWIRNSLLALYVEFYVLFKLFFSFFSTQSSRFSPYLYYTFPNSIPHHSQLLSPVFTSPLLCPFSLILFRTNSRLLIIHLSFYINHFVQFSSPSPPIARTFCLLSVHLQRFLCPLPFSWANL